MRTYYDRRDDGVEDLVVAQLLLLRAAADGRLGGGRLQEQAVLEAACAVHVTSGPDHNHAKQHAAHACWFSPSPPISACWSVSHLALLERAAQRAVWPAESTALLPGDSLT